MSGRLTTLTVVGIDPGTTTGWAAIRVPTKTIFGDEPGRIEEWECGDVTGPEDGQVTALCHILKRFPYPAVALEDFRVKRLSKEESYLSPVRVGAKLRFAIAMSMAGDVTGVEMQMPELAMETAPDSRLKTWGLYEAGPDHKKDATRHAITLIRRAKADQKLRYRIFHAA